MDLEIPGETYQRPKLGLLIESRKSLQMLELKHAEREHSAILELAGEQRERVARGDHREHPEKESREAGMAELRREIERLREENRKLRQNREREQ